MVDEFMVCVDRIIATACFESVNETGERLLSDEANHVVQVASVDNNKNRQVGCCSNMVRECRICQEEDEQHQMEAPCACNGTLKANLISFISSCIFFFMFICLMFFLGNCDFLCKIYILPRPNQ